MDGGASTRWCPRDMYIFWCGTWNFEFCDFRVQQYVYVLYVQLSVPFAPVVIMMMKRILITGEDKKSASYAELDVRACTCASVRTNDDICSDGGGWN